MGDVISLGATKKVRQHFGYDDSVNKCSTAYKAGELAGIAHSLALGSAAGLRAAGTKAIGKELSHWIPARMGGSRSLWNGNYVTKAEHALSDPYRYRFMSRIWKAENPMPNVISQQWKRLPNSILGTGAGAGYGGASISINESMDDNEVK